MNNKQIKTNKKTHSEKELQKSNTNDNLNDTLQEEIVLQEENTPQEENALRLRKAFTMKNVINSFNKLPNIEINHKQTESDIQSIISDSERCFHFINDNEKIEYQEILKKVLLKIRIPYYQGMADISAYILYYILTTNLKSGSVTILNLNPSEEKLEEVSKILEKILFKKVLPLVENDFKKYKEMNEIFIKILKNKNIEISNEKSMTFISNILTFFTRDCLNLEDTYFILSVILSCPSNIPFLILIKFFKEIENKQKLKVFGDSNFLKDLILLEDEYLEIQTKQNELKTSNTSKFILGSSLIIGVVAVGLYFINKK